MNDINDPLRELRALAIAVWKHDDDPRRPEILRLQAEYIHECGRDGGSLDGFLEWIDWLDLLKTSVAALEDDARFHEARYQAGLARVGGRMDMPLWHARDGGPLDPAVTSDEQRAAFFATWDADPARALTIDPMPEE